jgi:peptidoglycan-associated lipoprotein
MKPIQLIKLIVIGLILFVPHNLNAQPQGPHVTYLESITEDEEGGKIYFPSFVFAEPVRNEIYIIDSGSRIIIYTSDFYPLFTLGKRNGAEAPQGLTVDKEGNLYVAQSPTKDNPRNRISVFNACLKWDRDIYLEGFEGSDSFSPYRLAIDKNGNIYVSGSYHPNVLVLNNQGKLLDIISPEEEGRKAKLTNVTLDKTGRIYIVSEEEGHIYVYDENRKFLFKFGEKGGSSGKLSRPLAVGVDNCNGRMYVVDYMRHTVNVYDNTGKYLFEFGGLGWGEGWFQHPRDIYVDSVGRILVADTFNNRIEVFQPPEVKPEKIPAEEITEERLVEIETKEVEAPISIEEKIVFEDIHFDFDKYDIRPNAVPILQKVASWLLKNTFAKIFIEGHCDERGTNQYNLALGDRRAKATKDYLTALGVVSNRIEMVSYGEEKPLCTEKTEECWAKNRRAHFVILKEASE